MLFYVEEIGASELRISLRLAGANGRRADVDGSEFSSHIRDHHVLDLELRSALDSRSLVLFGAARHRPARGTIVPLTDALPLDSKD